MADPQDQNQIPPPPPGFTPVKDSAAPPPPPGFTPVGASTGTVARRGPGHEQTVDPSILKEAAQGVAGGLLETTAGIGGLIQKIPVIGPKIIPQEGLERESQIAESLQQTPTQKLGAGAETVGEFAAGDVALESGLARLGKVAAKYPHVMEILEKFPKAAKTIMKSGAVGGVEGGVKESRPGGEGTVAGAEHGAVGGMVGGTAAEATGAVVKPVAKAAGLLTSAEEDITRAAQPGKRNYRFLEDWGLAKDRIAKEVEEGGKFKDLGEAADRIRDVRQNLWKDEVMPAIDKHKNEELFPSSALPVPSGTAPAHNPVAAAIRSKITPAMQKVSKQSSTAIDKFAQKFEAPMKVGEAEQLLEHMNAELDVKGYWKKSPAEKAAAEKADPFVASRVAATDELRQQLYNYLDNAGEKGIKDVKRTYGAIANVEKEIRGQAPVAGRQRPLSLKQIITLASGHPLGIAASFADKIYNSPESLLNRAIAKSEPAGPVKAAIQDIASGAGTAAAKAAPAMGSIMFRASDGSIRTANADQWEEIQKVDPGAQQVHAGGGKK